MMEFKVDKKSFTLIEVFIVVTIIIILAALTIPNIRRQRINSNEAAAISGLKTLHTALNTYKDISSVYPENLTILASGTSAFIPTVLVTACSSIGGLSENYHGYQFCYNRTNNYTYTCSAYPHPLNVTGTRFFRVTKSGVIEVELYGNWNPLE